MIEWSTTRSTGTSGSIVFGVLAHRLGDGAHRRQVGEQRHAGEVLQDDAGDDERDLVERAAPSACQSASSTTCSGVTFLPSQLRSTDSSTMRIETGSRPTLGYVLASSGSE